MPKGEKVKAEKSKKVSPYSKKQHKKKEEVLKNLDLHKDEKQKLHKNGKSKVNSILKTAPHSDRVVGAFQNSEERLVIPKVKFASISNGLKIHSFFCWFQKIPMKLHSRSKRQAPPVPVAPAVPAPLPGSVPAPVDANAAPLDNPPPAVPAVPADAPNLAAPQNGGYFLQS